MCYLIAKKFKKSGCIALKATRGEELAKFSSNLQNEVGDNIQIVTITRPTAYGEYEPYQFVHSYDYTNQEFITICIN